MKYLLILICLSTIFFANSCKTKQVPPSSSTPIDPVEIENMWKTIDSLEKKGLISSALDEVRKIKQKALAGRESGHLVKASLYENKYLIQLEEDSAIKALSRAEEEMKQYPEPALSVMHSLVAQWYTVYLQSHLWELRSRTEFGGPAGPDIRTWGVRHFVEKIQEHYALSNQWDGLKSAKVEDYSILLTEAQKTDDLRPTLYDILMHRAIDFYSGNESFLTKPEYDYVLTDPLAFSPARSFIGHSFPTTDSLSSTWQALQWFQQLLAFRLSDNNHQAALVDADLKRLRFVYDHIILEEKDSIYLKTLEQLSQNHKNNPESALVDYHRAEILVRLANNWVSDKNSPYRFGYNEALTICNKAIEQFPDAYGSQLCKTLIRQINQKSLSATIESINLPNEELLAKIDYRNLSEIHLKLVKLPESPKRWQGDRWEGDEILQRLNQLQALRSWKQSIDHGNDHQEHSTEIAVPAMTFGHYALMVSDDPGFTSKSSTTGTMMFTISGLGYWYIDDKDEDEVVAVINRRSGQAQPGVKTEFYTYEYNAARRRQEEIKIGEGISNSQGWVDVPSHENKNIVLRLTNGEDELFQDDAYYTYRQGGQSSAYSTTLFFSDRAIYRPGQKIYFKGYALNFDHNRIPSIATNQNVNVVLYDANGQEVTKQKLKSNEYGTFSGTFDLPVGGLTGQMSLSADHGPSRYYFQVEEYKRPKFEVTFDTLKVPARLNEEVTIHAKAKDYAGSAVSGAKARYRVERVTFRPWWYGYWKGIWPAHEDRQVLASGQALSDDEGNIDITFLAKPKAGGDPDLMYRFEITLFVTDITGESHEATKAITLNKQGFEINIDLTERVSLEKVKEISVISQNSDGARVKVNGDVEISRLQGPKENKRNRLWPIPDIMSLSDGEYESRFRHYFPPGKEQMSSWVIENVLGKKSVAIDGTGNVDLSSLITTPGYYKVDWTWKDELGKSLNITQYALVFDRNQKLPGNEVIQVDFKDEDYEPGNTLVLDVLTGLTAPPKAIRLVEHRTSALFRKPIDIPEYDNLEVKVTEADRGGMYLYHLIAFNNRFYTDKKLIRVPWTNKDLKVALKTWRDKMEPGDEETWTITVEGRKMEKVMAEILLSMYDASLDAFIPHQWQMSLYPSTMSRVMIRNAQPETANYWVLSYHWDQTEQDVPWRQYRDINMYGYYPEGGYYPRSRGGYPGKYEDGMIPMQANEAAPAGKDVDKGSTDLKLEDSQEATGKETAPEIQTPPPLRTALDETVFFFPQIKTDAQGQLTFNFKMKEGLTRWKFQALAHTKDLAFGLTQAEVVTQKELMVFPNPPRFFREGDTIAFQLKVTNMSDQSQSGNVQLKIIDAITNEDVTKAWKSNLSGQSIQIKSKGSTQASWTLQVPDGWSRPVKYQVMASAGSFTDGEESLLPVVTNRVLITETLPLPIKAKETKTFVFKSMIENRSSSTSDHQFTVEMTTSPAWYAVQALPYLMEYPHECSEQVFSRLYANALASHIATKVPAIQQVYDTWRLTGDDALVSNLEKNKDLKSAMLEETPWVRDAMGETQQKKDIAILFETNRMRHEAQQAIIKLRQMQLSNGGFPWFPEGRDNWYITQYIMEGMGHLRKMGVNIAGVDYSDIVQSAVPYLDSRMIEWYEELQKQAKDGKLKLEDHQISSIHVHYLYTRSFFPEVQHAAKMDEINNYLKTQVEKYWLQHHIYDQGLMALGSYRAWPNNTVSKEILASLRERTIFHEELGRYWKINTGYHWYEAPVELQSLMIELYQDMKVPQAEIDELRVWLLKNKQTTRWHTTKATAAAIYALLIHPDAWLQSVGSVEVKLGNTIVFNSTTSSEAGTGYVKKTWGGTEIKNEWSSISVANPNSHIAWGGAYWQYWEDIDKVKSSVEDNPLKISRSLLIVKETNRGEETTPAPARSLKVGDKLIVRLTIETDRAMEFVHLKDLRASGFEPMDVLSGNRWKGGLGYYQSTKDLATHFFIDYLPRGKFVIEYPVTVSQAGNYSEGLASLQCMYAPEFGSHSEGSRIAASLN